MAFYLGYLNPLRKIVPLPQVGTIATDDQLREDTPTLGQSPESLAMSRDPSPEIADLVQDMNEAAGKLPSSGHQTVTTAEAGYSREDHGKEQHPRRSPRKRPSPRALEPSPELIKRRRTAEPPTSSGRLKRKSLSSQPRPPKQNRDSYEIQVEDSDSAEEAQGAPEAPLPAPNRKQVRLLRRKATNPSPLKGQGEIQIRGTSKVNIDDSPSKKPRGRPKKVEIRSRNRNDEDRVKAVSEVDPESLSGSHEDSEDETPASQPAARQKKNSKRRPAAREEQAVRTANAEMTGSDSGAARRGKTREEEKREREDKREKDRTKELKGIERIANLHGWGTDLAWGDLCAAVTELHELKNTTKPESRQGARVCRKIHCIADRYRAADKESEYEEVEELPSIAADIESLSKSIWQYPGDRVNALNERAKKARDLYGHIVLDLVRLLQKVLRNRQTDGSFAQEVYDEMCSLLEASWNAADLACKWQPRPSQLDGGVLRLMRDDVRKNLGFLKEKYLAHREDYRGTKEEQTLDDVAKIQQRTQEHLWGPVRQRRQEIQARNRRRAAAKEAIVISEDEGSEGEIDHQGEEQALQETNEAPDRQLGLLTPPSEPGILDNFHALQKKNQEAQDNARRERWNAIFNRDRRRPETTGVAAATEQAILDIDDVLSQSDTRSERIPTPPRGDRAQTEEIPGPVQPPVWTEQERIVFQNLLQRFTGPSRFEQILAQYGGQGGLLQRHDLDSLMSLTNFIKDSKIIEIRTNPEKWVWLTGVS